jgi:hypothetical protein
MRRKKDEFTYLDDLTDEELNQVKKMKRIYIDPGKKSLLTITHDDEINKIPCGECRNCKKKKACKVGSVWSFTNRQHLHNTKRLKYQRLRRNQGVRKGIDKLDKELVGYNSKSCNYETYMKYVKKKVEIDGKIRNKEEQYEYFKIYLLRGKEKRKRMKKEQNENEKVKKGYDLFYLNKLKRYARINKQRSYDKLMEEIKRKYGKDVVIIMGDWSISKQMKNFISTPNLGLKRELAKKFKLYDFDEYNTSSLSHKTHEKCENLYLPDKKGVYRKMHSILTYKNTEGRKECINRDNNAVKNMKRLANEYLETKTRDARYQRPQKSLTRKRKVDKDAPLGGVLQTGPQKMKTGRKSTKGTKINTKNKSEDINDKTKNNTTNENVSQPKLSQKKIKAL